MGQEEHASAQGDVHASAIYREAGVTRETNPPDSATVSHFNPDAADAAKLQNSELRQRKPVNETQRTANAENAVTNNSVELAGYASADGRQIPTFRHRRPGKGKKRRIGTNARITSRLRALAGRE